MKETREIVLHHALPWSTARPVYVKVTLPKEPWVCDTTMSLKRTSSDGTEQRVGGSQDASA